MVRFAYLPWLSLSLLLLSLQHVLAFTITSVPTRTWRVQGVSSLAMAAKAKKSKLTKALVKNTLTVSVDVTEGDELLSKRLRTTGVATIFADASQLPTLAKEQQRAKGDFPGPVPVILREGGVSAESISVAKDAGAAGVVLPLSELGSEGAMELSALADKAGLESLWEVTSTDEFSAAADAGAKAFLVSSIEESFGVNPAFWEGSAKGRTVIAEIRALQAANSEIGLGRSLGAAGCKAVLLSGACSGGEDDHRYVGAAFRALRSKANPEFQIGGLMGQASAVGLSSVQSHATKEPTVLKENMDHPHML